ALTLLDVLIIEKGCQAALAARFVTVRCSDRGGRGAITSVVLNGPDSSRGPIENSPRSPGQGGRERSGREEAILRTQQTGLLCSLVWGVGEAAKALKEKEEPIGRII
ncbi:MAG: hypothetical protein WBW33_14655, partial [Bryobacteraceae bacterium]